MVGAGVPVIPKNVVAFVLVSDHLFANGGVFNFVWGYGANVAVVMLSVVRTGARRWLTNIAKCKKMRLTNSIFCKETLLSPKPPSHFYPDLTESRLAVIATALLDIRYSTLNQMSTRLDDNYTKETAVFGRSKNRLKELCQSSDHEWLTLANLGMDITFRIGSVPCRFFRDDPKSPDKAGFFKRNYVDDLFSVDENHPVLWRFVVEGALTEEDEDRVFFNGYNAYQEKVSEWMYKARSTILHGADKQALVPAIIHPVEVGLLDDLDSIQESVIRKTTNDS